MTEKSPIPQRFKEIRSKLGISQEKLGVIAGLEPTLANTRINQYERAVHSPKYTFVKKLAQAVNVPVAYFYSDDDEVAELLIKVGNLGIDKVREVIDKLEYHHVL